MFDAAPVTPLDFCNGNTGLQHQIVALFRQTLAVTPAAIQRRRHILRQTIAVFSADGLRDQTERRHALHRPPLIAHQGASIHEGKVRLTRREQRKRSCGQIDRQRRQRVLEAPDFIPGDRHLRTPRRRKCRQRGH